MTFATFFVLQGLNFVIVTVNYRAVAHGHIGWVVATDGLICLLTWSLLKRITEATGWSARLGYVAGGMAGAATAMVMTRGWS